MEFHKTNNEFDFVIILIKFKIININSKKGFLLLKNVITDLNLTDDEIKRYLNKKNLSFHDLRNKINDKLYGDLSKQKAIEAVEKACKKENLNNSRKIEYYRRKNLIENLGY